MTACAGALGVGAFLCLPQSFVQSSGAATRTSRPSVASSVEGATRSLDMHIQSPVPAGVVPVLGLGLAGVAALAAKTTYTGRSPKAARASRGIVSLRAFENELGVQAPVGFFDPLGFSADGDIASFKRRRSVEIKHGRICMLATMGYITPEITGKLPGYLSPSAGLKFEDVPNGLAAISKVPGLGWSQIFMWCAYAEITNGYEWDTKEPGNVGWNPPLLVSSDPETRKRRLSAELANGRLAMMAIIGMFFQDGLTGSAWGDWALYTGSPLRAFENELGVQAPAGFWDPLGLAKDGDLDQFKRRRSVEIKHGRVSMLAAMGYMTPEITGKWPGYLSPSAGLKFADIPNGLAAVSKVPAAGWFQILAYGGYCEISGGFDEYEKGAPGDYGFKVLTSDDPEVLKRKLNAELANGRLAMMAIIGMFFQDGLTGSAWGDWSLYDASPLRVAVHES